MSNSSKILLSLLILLIVIGAAVWWFVSSQNNSQSPEPAVTPATGDQAAAQSGASQNTQAVPTKPADNQAPGANPASAAPSSNLTTGNTNDDIANDLTNVDGQMNNLNSDITISSQIVAPVTAQ